MNIVIFLMVLLASGFTFVYFIANYSSRTSDGLIQAELDAGKALRYRTRVGGAVDNFRYKGPLLVLAFFDDCFIIKDRKVPFLEIKSINQTLLMGVVIEIYGGQSVSIYDNSCLKYFPGHLRP